MISNGWPSLTAVIVPWSIPVGTALIRAFSSRRITSSGSKPGGEVDVADRQAEQVVANRAADIARQALLGAERVEQPRPCPRRLRHFAASSFSSIAACATRLTIIAAVAPQILRPFHSIS